MGHKLTKYVIRQSLRELQDRRTFTSYAELAQAVEEDLEAEGLELDTEDRVRIKVLVEEEGYTGRFALDDILRRKLKNRKYLPVASLVAGVVLFLASTTAAAVIEHFVQSPLEGKTPAALTAVFQIPSRADLDRLAFKVTIHNLSPEPLQDLVLFASAGSSVVQQFPVPEVGPGRQETVSAALDLSSASGEEVEFSAYVIGAGFSYRSEPMKVARGSGGQLAAVSTERTARQQMNQGGMPPMAMAKAQAPAAVAVADEAVPPGALAEAAPPQESTLEEVQWASVQASSVSCDEDVNRLIGRVRDIDCPVSKQLLEVYRDAGNAQAAEFLASASH